MLLVYVVSLCVYDNYYDTFACIFMISFIDEIVHSIVHFDGLLESPHVQFLIQIQCVAEFSHV